MTLRLTERRRRLAYAAATGVGAGSLVVWAYFWVGVARGNLQGPDFVSFYAAVRLYALKGGAAVYDLAMQKQFELQVIPQPPDRFIVLPYFHPPYYTLLIAPLAALSYRQAYYAMAAFNVVLVAALIVLLVRNSLSIHGRGSLVAAAMIAGFFLTRRAWRALAGFVGVVAALGVVSVVGFGLNAVLTYLGLVGAWAVGGKLPTNGQLVYTDTAAYSLRNILEAVPGAGKYIALVVLVLLLVLAALSLSWRPDKPRLDFAVAVAASLVLSPHQNVHDLALMVIPGFALADLALAGQLRSPRAAAVVLAVGYGAINMTLAINLWSAALGALLVAALIVLLVRNSLSIHGRGSLVAAAMIAGFFLDIRATWVTAGIRRPATARPSRWAPMSWSCCTRTASTTLPSSPTCVESSRAEKPTSCSGRGGLASIRRKRGCRGGRGSATAS